MATQSRRKPRLRICRKCGAEFVAHRDVTVCAECSHAARHSPTIIRHVCAMCGNSFDGGPSARYCPRCRKLRQAETDRRKRRQGAVRPIGSTDICKACGKPYTVTGGLQKYCKACAAAEAAKAIAARKAERYYAGEIVRAPRKAHFVCRICGGPIPLERSKKYTCSDACARELTRQMQRRADAKRSPRHWRGRI